MRWDNLRIEADDEHRLPGYRDPAVVRTFDAPEALDIRFYEVRARSALNRVPKQSRVPFRWTINPYRGCSHACVYCLAGDTPILMGDGRTRQLADLRPGDEIYGTERRGAYRRLVRTHVLAHWSSVKPAYRVVLEDGTELLASADHRFLTKRGWKHVTGAEQGRDRRPHLTLNDALMGVGRLAAAPVESDDYRLGYLCGMVRGDGHVGSYSYERPGRTIGSVHRLRLALADEEPQRRTRAYLERRGVRTDEFAFAPASAPRRAIAAIRTSSRAGVEGVREAIAWPAEPSLDWCRGFLAGIFDAEGSYSGGVLRISNTDPEILARVEASLQRLGFPFVADDRRLPNGLVYIRLVGGMQAHRRFLHSVDPATSRKRSVEGRAINTAARLRVVAIEPTGVEMELFDVTTGTGDFIANGVVSHNCFARPTHTYLDFDAGRDFEREIVVKVNVPEVLRTELARPSWQREHVALGTNTDPYQWVEARYRLMPGIWEAFRDFANPCSILTKSPLVLRDLPLLQQVAERAEVSANLSVPTLDEKAWRATEPHTPNPRARLEAVAELNRAGIPTGVLIAPLMPGINDDPAQVERILELAGEAGAVGIGGIALHLRGEVREIFMGWLESYRPDLVPRYERLYARGAYALPEERKRIQELVASRRPVPAPRMRGATRPPPPPPPRSEQPRRGEPRREEPRRGEPRREPSVTQPTLF